jgi:hypothetical protein
MVSRKPCKHWTNRSSPFPSVPSYRGPDLNDIKSIRWQRNFSTSWMLISGSAIANPFWFGLVRQGWRSSFATQVEKVWYSGRIEYHAQAKLRYAARCARIALSVTSTCPPDPDIDHAAAIGRLTRTLYQYPNVHQRARRTAFILDVDIFGGRGRWCTNSTSFPSTDARLNRAGHCMFWTKRRNLQVAISRPS